MGQGFKEYMKRTDKPHIDRWEYSEWGLLIPIYVLQMCLCSGDGLEPPLFGRVHARWHLHPYTNYIAKVRIVSMEYLSHEWIPFFN